MMSSPLREHSPNASAENACGARTRIEGDIVALYIAGWLEADPAKIAAAAAPGYDFHDPLIGHFSMRSLPRYFGILRARFAASHTRHLAFALHGPIQSLNGDRPRRYWREAPLLGLAGESEIIVTHRGIAAESVAYDLNVASEALRGCARMGAAQPGRRNSGFQPSSLRAFSVAA
jgi:hypothetical protein